ncbi:inositol monophosphatase [Sinorhizobium meliloti]|uniref:Inositol monophosphatase family protein n=1 Tax=Sinorhizobium meliloti (strain SM11) TaxID=707241 RepID=F7X811_SINMM|nr:inositol monophosphatase [Sinorhizobium meliloti]AEH78890.1 inositol monophosphatase family protein [Sinorhizobium meliloti SM11]ARS71921.1 inositol monophosphatase [Sinorhizobium meliloti RU11/001]MDE3790799.1 inositol monophosphatase [Sinorhizobium meliloti]MDE4558248.1 inositol monophosphatase [Sinorhizobium meliloti SM11]RVG68763.1 inositol monophosphatase [Sinorhizobium meliloti]
MSHSVDIAALANLLQEAAVKEILPRFRNLGSGDVRMKSEAIDLVTEGDEAAERLIKANIDAIAPGAVFIGEESVAADPALLDKLAGADLAIVVDPIDGTFNFAAGLPLFGVMASVVAGGETVAGIIYDPLGNDWVIAERGSGAWMCRPDGMQERLSVTAGVTVENMVGVASAGFYAQAERRIVMGNMAKVRMATSYRCAAHEYRIFAGGHLHFLMYQKLMPWDHLAGTLIAEEAGAYAARFDGSRYLPAHTNGGLLLATDRDSWEELRREVFTV